MLLTHWEGGGDASAPIHSREAGQPLDRSPLIGQMVSWTGPLPPPAAAREYEDLVPGACERLLTLMERQADHRRWVEREVVSSATVAERRGQGIAALIGVLAIICGTYLMATNHNGWGFATIVTAIAGLVGASVFSRRQPYVESAMDPSEGEEASIRARGARPGR